jgi:protein-tyrosine phosphatase
VQAGGAAQRAYFLLQPDQGEARWISLRHLPLEGAPNFRDLGGYQTVDSKQLRWGILYRSGELGHLTDADQVYMRSLNLQSLVDFRTSRERTRLPDRWPENVVGSDADKRLYAPIGDEPGNDTQKLIQEAFLYHAPPERLRALMTLAYEGFALQGASTYGQAFRQIIDGKVPMVYHCTAGKDRAGLFSAILLAILGVPQETIRYDYMLSNEYLLAPEALRQMTQAISSAAPDAPPPSRESVAVMAGVDEAYLTASFAAIDRRYGSFDAYRREALGLSVQDVRKLREILLMP